MRHMSFFLTTKQVQARTKTVTRRLGWKNLRPGQTFWACRKCQGLKAGEKVERLAPLRCVSNEAVRLDTIDADDVAREGFPDMTPAEFVAMFCRHMKVTPETMVQRIEFEYLDVAKDTRRCERCGVVLTNTRLEHYGNRLCIVCQPVEAAP